MKTRKYPFLYVSVLYFACAAVCVAQMLLAGGVAFGEKLDINSIASIVYAFVFLTFGLIIFAKEAPIAAPVWNALLAAAHIVHGGAELLNSTMTAVLFVLFYSLSGTPEAGAEIPPVYVFPHIAAFLAGMTACVVFILMLKGKKPVFKKIWFVPAAVSALWVTAEIAVLCLTGESYYAFNALISAASTAALVLTGKILKDTAA